MFSSDGSKLHQSQRQRQSSPSVFRPLVFQGASHELPLLLFFSPAISDKQHWQKIDLLLAEAQIGTEVLLLFHKPLINSWQSSGLNFRENERNLDPDDLKQQQSAVFLSPDHRDSAEKYIIDLLEHLILVHTDA